MTDEGLSPSVAPAFEASEFDCPHCGITAAQSWSDLLVVGGFQPSVGPVYVPAADMSPMSTAENPFGTELIIRMTTCSECQAVALWRGQELVYPT